MTVYKGFRGDRIIAPKVNYLVPTNKPRMVIPGGCKMFILSTKTWKLITHEEYEKLPNEDKAYTLWDWAINKNTVKKKFKKQIEQLHPSHAKKEELFKIVDDL